jgi:hypothetical protein
MFLLNKDYISILLVNRFYVTTRIYSGLFKY